MTVAMNEFTEQPRSLPARLTFPVYVLVMIPYLAWRIEITYRFGEWYFWPLLASEMLSIALMLSHLVTCGRIRVPVARPGKSGLTVDVFIPTYNEPEDVVKLTVIGALAVRGRRKVFLLDDGCRLNMRLMAESLGAEYVARQDNTHAKAGNMNAGILHSNADLMLFLDCDHVPQPDFIERTIGYFDDPKLAFVQTPQLFYNTQSVQFRPTRRRPLWNEQSMFYEAIQPSKNRFNAAFFCGSGALVRRAAIDSIGGFATGTATEDIHTSLRLHARGWRSLFVNEQLAHGIAPINMTEYHRQRTRWGAGSLGLLFRSPDSPLAARGLTLAQRICYFNSTFSFANGVQRIFYMLFPAALLLVLPFTINDFPIDAPYYAAIMVGFIAFSYGCVWITSDGTYHPILTEEYNLANMFSHLAALQGVLRVSAKFSVSLKGKASREISAVEAGLLVLCIVLGSSNLFGLGFWVWSGRPLGNLLSNMTGLALFWNTLNLLLTVPFLLFLRRHDAREARPCALAVPSAPASLVNGTGDHDVFLTGLDLAGAAIRAPETWTATGDHRLFLHHDRKWTEIAGTVADIRRNGDGTHDFRLEFGKLSPRQATAITLYLFHVIVPRTLRYGPSAGPAPLTLPPHMPDDVAAFRLPDPEPAFAARLSREAL
jgi:cellulose synthase/poly-beta-1,6-N-acetylglucosamine synthase-like glycosyltransferase